MSGELLSKVFLQFKDEDMRQIYRRAKTDFYSRAMPTVAAMLFVHAAGLSVGYRFFDQGDLREHFEVMLPNGRNKRIYEHQWLYEMINGSFFVFFVILSIIHSWCPSLHVLVCPVLNLYLYYHIAMVDYDMSILSIQNA
jgi:hypothetical protein